MRIEADVIKSLKNRGVYIVHSVRAGATPEKNSPAVATAVIVDAVFKAIETGTSWTATGSELAAVFDCPSMANILRHLLDIGMLDSTPVGNKVYYTPRMTYEKECMDSLYISSYAHPYTNYELVWRTYSRVMQSPRDYNSAAIAIDGETSIPSDNATILAYDYDKFLAKKDPVTVFYWGEYTDNKLKAAWLKANNVKRLPNQFELIGPHFWEQATSLYFARTSARSPITGDTPDWSVLPDSFWDVNTPTYARATMYTEMTNPKMPLPTAQAPTTRIKFPASVLRELHTEEPDIPEVSEDKPDNVDTPDTTESAASNTDEATIQTESANATPVPNSSSQLTDMLKPSDDVKGDDVKVEPESAVNTMDKIISMMDIILDVGESNMPRTTKATILKLILK